jgi:hypothetical protein
MGYQTFLLLHQGCQAQKVWEFLTYTHTMQCCIPEFVSRLLNTHDVFGVTSSIQTTVPCWFLVWCLNNVTFSAQYTCNSELFVSTKARAQRCDTVIAGALHWSPTRCQMNPLHILLHLKCILISVVLYQPRLYLPIGFFTSDFNVMELKTMHITIQPNI